jgi:hypothetical protein
MKIKIRKSDYLVILMIFIFSIINVFSGEYIFIANDTDSSKINIDKINSYDEIVLIGKIENPSILKILKNDKLQEKVLKLIVKNYDKSLVNIIENFFNLESLSINYSYVGDLPNPSRLKNLKNLTFESIEDTCLPKNFEKYTFIENLYINNSKNINMNLELNKLKNFNNLRRLYIGFTNFSDLRVLTNNFSSINFLYLGYNKLTYIPKDIEKLSLLKVLMIFEDIKEIPKEFENLKQLKLIYIDLEKLDKISVERVKKIKYVNFGDELTID